MARTKALRPRKRVGNRFEQSPSAGPPAPLAAPLHIGTPGALFSANVSGPSAPFPVSYNTFRGDSGGAPLAGAPADTTTASSRPAPSLPFAGLELPLPTDVTNSSSSSNSSAASDACRTKLASEDGAGREKREEEEGSGEAGASEETITISRLELERWQQKVVFQVEDHFSSALRALHPPREEATVLTAIARCLHDADEQLKRIAEFGRVHASLLVEAKQYVYSVEQQLAAQLEQERASLRAQAEAFVAKVSDENALLRARIQALEQETAALRGGAGEDQDTDMAPPPAAASDECVDQENSPALTNNADASDLPSTGRDALEHLDENASETLMIKSCGALTPLVNRLDGVKPVSATPTSINQVPELETA